MGRINDIRQCIDKMTSSTGLKTGGEGGVTSYDDLDDRPKINGHTLTGNQSSEDLGIEDPDLSDYYTKEEVDGLIPDLSDYYTKEETEELIPDMTDVITVGKADPARGFAATSTVAYVKVDGSTIDFNDAGELECVKEQESVSYTAGANETRSSMIYNLVSLVDFSKLSQNSYIRASELSKHYTPLHELPVGAPRQRTNP